MLPGVSYSSESQGQGSEAALAFPLYCLHKMPAAHAWPGCQAPGAVIKLPRLAQVQQSQVVTSWFFSPPVCWQRRSVLLPQMRLAPCLCLLWLSWLPKENSRAARLELGLCRWCLSLQV